MKKVNLVVVVLWSLLILPTVVRSQCPNLNFAYGTFTSWTYYAGSCANGNYSVAPSQPIPSRVEVLNAMVLIQQGKFYDEICSKIPKVPDGYNFSCKLGNDSAGSQVDGLEYEMTVDSNSSLLILYFAWVMQRDSFASINEQPQFTLQIRDSTGSVLNISCGNLNFTAQDSMQNLACDTNGLVARTWTTVGYSLESFIGQKIKIYFEVRDGEQGGFCYAYVVGECRPMRIELAYCDGSIAGRMRAPDGFVSYTWTRSTDSTWIVHNQQTILPNPKDGEIFTCTLVSELGCVIEVKTVIARTDVYADFKFGTKNANGHVDFASHNNQSWYDTCSRTVTFVDMSGVHNSKKSSLLWEIPSLKTTPPANSRDSMWTYTFPDPDVPTTYLVRLTVFAENGCSDTSQPANHYITIYPSAKVRINGPSQLCETKRESLIATPLRSKFVEHYWSWIKKDGTTGSTTGDSLPITGPGTYYLQSLDTNGCYAYDTLVVTSLKPKINNLTIKNVDCFGNATGSFSYSGITGGAGFLKEARWIVWDNVNKVFVDSSIVHLTTVNFRNQIAGKYAFYGVDIDDCPIIDTVEIQEPDSLYFSSVTKATTCFIDNGKIAFEIVGGVSPHNTSINGAGKNIQTGKIKDTIANLAADVYAVKIVDKNNCVATDTVTVAASAVQLIPLSSVSIVEKDITININKDTALHVVLAPAEACNKDVVWQSNDANIASVNANGKVRAISYGTTYITVTSADGSLKDSCKITVPGVGIAEGQVSNQPVQVYPNPTTGKLTIECRDVINHVSTVEIYSVVGQCVYTSPNPSKGGELAPSLLERAGGEVVLDISHLPAGMYFLKIGNRTARFVKE